MHPRLESAFSLEGRTAVVTGAARGIGRQAAVTFAQAGADVVIADVLADSLADTAAAVEDLGRRATVVPTDVSSKSAVDRLAETAVAEHGRIDVWANVAGILRSGMIVDTDEDTLESVIAVNLKGVYWGGAAAARAMLGQTPNPEGTRGSIINIASAGGDMPAPGISVYALTKAAVMMYTRTLATEVGAQGIRVNAVAPGFIDTPMVAVHYLESDGSVNESKRDAVFASRAAQAPMQRTGEPEDITWAMLYLASDASRFMTGQVVRPNGGVVMP
ncbi:MAG: glucose 1-dehydrogenase [Acidimicrobiales bacterium]|nr:glucose 1-dehydrogenase [Acidimicrobiales bacterium]